MYFDQEESIARSLGDAAGQDVLLTIAQRFMAQHPAQPFAYRCFSEDGFANREDGRYDIDLSNRLPQARNGQKAHVFGQCWCDTDKEYSFLVSCYAPVVFYVNGVMQFQPTVLEEVNPALKRLVTFRLHKGFNTFLLTCTKTAAGFGCCIGTHRPQWEPINIHAPFAERDGQTGWIYSEAIDAEIYDEGRLPDRAGSENATGVRWYPDLQWSAEAVRQTPVQRIFGTTHASVLAWTAWQADCGGEYVLTGHAQSPIDLWIGATQYLSGVTGAWQLHVPLVQGRHQILVRCSGSGERDWGFSLSAQDGFLRQPHPVRGTTDPWLYAGPFAADMAIDDPGHWQSLQRVMPGLGGETWWRVDQPRCWLRPFVEAELYGRWTYPLGVTLYGLLQTGRLTGRQDLVEYVQRHVAMIADMHAVALWDKRTFGYPGINHQLTWLDALDDCGSFGSLMLEAQDGETSDTVRFVAGIVADHMRHRQERRPDGAFYRKLEGTFAENTLWADDLYMCVPFLCRYYRLSGDTAYLDEAATQCLLFRNYLFMPEHKVMSHVYDFKHDTATGIPWGRGNGWVLFSLSELLAILPQTHVRYSAVQAFFNELCEGYLALQGENGLWHQVLTHADAYEETSCTSMFVYAMARAIRLGWIAPALREAAMRAIDRAWQGLTRISIDKFGNVHGVCRGSLYSFTPEYYKNVLLWNLNDVHGTGIVMLAGIEVLKLRQALQRQG